jgi:hypothetical protein
MQFDKGICDSSDLFDDISNKCNTDLRFVIGLPKVSQISSVGPPKHEIALAFGDGCNELDNMLVVEFVNVDMSRDLSFPRLIKLSLFFFIASMDLLDVFNSNGRSLTVKLIKL